MPGDFGAVFGVGRSTVFDTGMKYRARQKIIAIGLSEDKGGLSWRLSSALRTSSGGQEIKERIARSVRRVCRIDSGLRGTNQVLRQRSTITRQGGQSSRSLRRASVGFIGHRDQQGDIDQRPLRVRLVSRGEFDEPYRRRGDRHEVP